MNREHDPASRRRLTREERELWQRTMVDVHPLRRRHAKPETETTEATPPPPVAKLPPAPLVRPSVPAPTKRPLPVPPPELARGDSPGVDRRTATRLRRGKLEVEARLDLHGHGRESAHRALDAFILRSVSAGKRCVLVVTGKGSRDGGIGIIRAHVPQWLNLAPLREHILSYNTARPQDGGEGAIYVLLRRKREAR